MMILCRSNCLLFVPRASRQVSYLLKYSFGMSPSLPKTSRRAPWSRLLLERNHLQQLRSSNQEDRS